MHEIHVHNVPRKDYKVTVIYAGFDSHGDKSNWNKEPDVYSVIVESSCTEAAVADAMKIICIERATIMTDFMLPHVMDDNSTRSWTYDEIESYRVETEEKGIFRDWLLIEPTAITVCLVEDEQVLKDMTTDSVMHNVEHVADEVEDFLKKGNNNDDA